jgi:hypothetical protein
MGPSAKFSQFLECRPLRRPHSIAEQALPLREFTQLCNVHNERRIGFQAGFPENLGFSFPQFSH